jgi:catalase
MHPNNDGVTTFPIDYTASCLLWHSRGDKAMTDDTAIKSSADRRLPNRRAVRRLGAIGAVLMGVALIFALVAGWLSPGRLTQGKMTAAFRQVNGAQPGFRLNHAKGVCFTGWFDSSGQAASFSKAALFKIGRVPLIGRFSLAGGMPFQPDKPASVRGFALRFLPVGEQEWRMGNLNLPVFPVNSVQGFYDQLLASTPDPATGKPDPQKMQVFLAGHPESVKALAIIAKRPISSGFSDSTYNGLNAFLLVNSRGASVPVRWSLVPIQPPAAEASGLPAPTARDYLFGALIAQLAEHPLQWRLLVSIGRPGDPTRDATLPWPSERQQVDAGTITVNGASSEAAGTCNDVNFDPTVLPSGIEPSDDPLLSARSAVYAASFTLRAGGQNEKAPSAVSPGTVVSGAKP